MSLFDYFAKPDTPAANSPVGAIMVKVLEKYPGMSFEDARVQANAMLDKAAGRFNYKRPGCTAPRRWRSDANPFAARSSPL
jgi:hypothetical protein